MVLVNHLFLAIRYEAKRKGIQVSILCPGLTKTDFFAKEGLKIRKEAMLVEKCVEYGYKKFLKNKEVIIPEILNILKIRFQ